MISLNPENRLLWIVVITVLLMAAVSFAQLPGSSLLWRALQNAAHVPFFMLITFLIYAGIRLLATDREVSWLRQLMLTAELAIVFAGLTEIVQIATGRVPSMLDWAHDILGVIAALIVLLFIEPHSRLYWRKRWRVLHGTALVALLGLLVYAFYPLASIAQASWQRDRAFPVVMDLQADWAPAFTDAQQALIEPAPAKTVPMAEGMARIVLLPGQYPSVEMIELSPDWSGYTSLAFTVWLPPEQANQTLEYLVLRVQDQQHNQRYGDRYNQRLYIKPGENHFRISLKSIRLAPQGREMAMQSMAALKLFAADLQQPVTFYLSAMRLLR